VEVQRRRFAMIEFILLGSALLSTAATVFFLNKHQTAVLPARAGARKDNSTSGKGPIDTLPSCSEQSCGKQ
jgi:hypothetical protein